MDQLWAGRRNNMQVKLFSVVVISFIYKLTLQITEEFEVELIIFLFVSSGMFSISQMKNRPMILIGG